MFQEVRFYAYILKCSDHNRTHLGYRDSRSGVYFNGHLLYARGQSWNKPDCIEVYDMTNFAEAIQTIKLHLDIIATRFFQNEK